MKVAVISPYYKEPIEKLRRCIDSVAAQTHPVTHILVADGFPNPELDALPIQHMRLPVSHRDYGDTPRSIGAVAALSQGFDAIAFLDSDNWYAPEHVELCVDQLTRHDAQVACARRYLVALDGKILPLFERGEVERQHVDTSGVFVRADVAYSLPWWCLLERDMGFRCDQFFFALLKGMRVRFGWLDRPTVYYETNYSTHYRQVGLEPPEKTHDYSGPPLDLPEMWGRIAKRFGFPLRDP